MSITLCSGKGQYDVRHTFLASGRENNSPKAGKPYEPLTYEGFKRLLYRPYTVPKEEAPWMLFSSGTSPDSRMGIYQELGRLYGCSFDVDNNNWDLEHLCYAFDNAFGTDNEFWYYSTKSSKPHDKRWRVITWFQHPVNGDIYRDTVLEIYKHLESNTLGLQVDKAPAKPTQIVYLPNKGDHYQWLIR